MNKRPPSGTNRARESEVNYAIYNNAGRYQLDMVADDHVMADTGDKEPCLFDSLISKYTQTYNMTIAFKLFLCLLESCSVSFRLANGSIYKNQNECS